jgi:hypothetical protein
VRLNLPGRCQAVAGLTHIAIGGLAAAPPASAAPEAPAQTAVEGNPSCADIAPPGVTWTELKVEPPTAGAHSDGTLSVNIVLANPPEGQTFDWSANMGVDAVIAKGGPNANVYTYDPESSAATGLHAPLNEMSGKYYDLSHITFCYDDTPSSTTTTTPGGSTTTTPGGPTTTAPGRRGELPRTGRHTGELAAMGGVLVAAGAVMMAQSARLRRA